MPLHLCSGVTQRVRVAIWWIRSH